VQSVIYGRMYIVNIFFFVFEKVAKYISSIIYVVYMIVILRFLSVTICLLCESIFIPMYNLFGTL
jgi:hypothetical protein